MSNRIYLKARHDPSSSLVQPRGVIKRAMRGISRLPPPGGDITPVNNLAGGYFSAPAIGGGSTQQTIVSLWVKNPPPDAVAINQGSFGAWRDQFASAYNNGCWSSLTNFQANVNDEMGHNLDDEDHYMWIWDNDEAPDFKSKFYKNGVQFLRNFQLGGMTGGRDLSQPMAFLSIVGGTFPFAAQGIAEYWFKTGVSWTDGDETKFYDNGAPADLGPNGETPYGTAPEVYLGGSMTVEDWNNGVNLGTLLLTKGGGDFAPYVQR